MIPLPTKFRSGQFNFEQIAREADIALFRKSKFYKHAKPPLNFETYEVVIVQHQTEDEIGAPLVRGWVRGAMQARESTGSWAHI